MKGKPAKTSAIPATADSLLGDIRRLIEDARAAVAVTVNAG
jgi:hypothetical protein